MFILVKLRISMPRRKVTIKWKNKVTFAYLIELFTSYFRYFSAFWKMCIGITIAGFFIGKNIKICYSLKQMYLVLMFVEYVTPN